MIAGVAVLCCTIAASAGEPVFSFIKIDRHISATTFDTIISTGGGVFDEALPPGDITSPAAMQNTLIGMQRIGGMLIGEPNIIISNPDDHTSHGSAHSRLSATFELSVRTQVSISALVSGGNHGDKGGIGSGASMLLVSADGLSGFGTPTHVNFNSPESFSFNQILDPGLWSLEVSVEAFDSFNGFGDSTQNGEIEFEMTISPPSVFVDFAPAANFPVGAGLSSMTAADFNGDGHIDFVTTNFDEDTVSVLLNDGLGNLTNIGNFQVGSLLSSPASVTAADLDGDGDIDLAVTGVVSNAGGVSVLLNDGGGNFIPADVYTVDNHHRPKSITSADFDSDGDIDLAMAVGAEVVVFFNDGSGAFASANRFAVGNESRSVIAADLNGDGFIDLATANTRHLSSTHNSVSVLFGNGAGGFAPAVNLSVFIGQPHGVTAVDIDGDGDLDLVTANGSSVSVFLNEGFGVFAPEHRFTVSAGQTVTAGDFDGDGRMDLATANGAFGLNGKVSPIINTTSGVFITASKLTVGIRPVAVISVDLNHDGRPDLVTANADSDTVSVLINQIVLNGADLNGDGFVDITDLSILLVEWGTPGGPADLNGDGTVNSADLAMLLASWIAPG